MEYFAKLVPFCAQKGQSPCKSNNGYKYKLSFLRIIRLGVNIYFFAKNIS